MLEYIKIRDAIILNIVLGVINGFLFDTNVGFLVQTFLLFLISFIPAWIIWLFNRKKGMDYFAKTYFIALCCWEILIILVKLLAK